MRKALLICVVALCCVNLALAAPWQVVKQSTAPLNGVDKGCFIDANTGWIVYNPSTSSSGLVAKTTDGGQTWVTLREPDNTKFNWNDIEFINENVGYACGVRGVIFKTVDGGLNWTMIADTNTYNKDLLALDVVTPDIVYFSGKSSTVLKTDNGGATFTSVPNATTIFNCDLRGIAFCNSNVGAVIFDNSTNSKAWYTHDGGTTWTEVSLAAVFPTGLTSKRVYDVAAGGDSTIVVAGYHNVCLVSKNGGKSFQAMGSYTYALKHSNFADVIDDNTFVVGGGSDNYIAKTTDGGTTWTVLNPGSGQSTAFADFVDANTGYVFCAYGMWYKTTDGGTTWTPLNSWPGVGFWGLAFPSPNRILLSTSFGGEITSSNDGGKTWDYPNNLTTNYGGSLFEIEFINDSTGYAGGDGGTLLKTSDSGKTWSTPIDNAMVSANKAINAMHVVKSNPNIIYIGGGSGYLLKSTDGGATWSASALTSGTSKTIYDICAIAENQVVLVAGSGEYCISTDGTTFSKVGAVTGTPNLRAVKFRNGVGIIPAQAGKVYRTTSWDALPTLVYTDDSGAELYDVEFVDDSTVYIVGQYGVILKSTDAGLTWAKETSPVNVVLQKVRYDAANGILWAVGQNGVILMNPVGALDGDYYIPKGSYAKGFNTLVDAVAALNNCGAIGAVRFLIDDNLNEIGSNLIITRNDLTAATPVVIKPAPGKTPSITITSFPTSGNHAKQGLTIENASYITIDGSNTEGGNTKDLTIIGDDATNGLYVVGVIDNSDFITIKNVKITYNNMLSTGTILGVDGYTGVPNKLVIENCDIGTPEKALTNGVALWGNDPATLCEAVVKNCNIYATRRGITTYWNTKNAYLNNNIEIVNPRADQAFYSGIYVTGFPANDTCLIANNYITAVRGNTSASKFAGGIVIYGNEGVVQIQNNFIATNFTNTGSNTANRVYGIVFGSTGWVGTANIINNTIVVNSTNQTGIHAAIGTEVLSSAKLNVFNNILVNNHDAANSYGIHWTNTPSATSVLSSDYNDIYLAGALAKTGRYGAIDYATLTDWKNATGLDIHSVSQPVNFVSDTDLHLTGASNGDNALGCPRIVTTDIDGEPRPEFTYMGADEASVKLTPNAVREEGIPVVTKYALEQNFPNPFNPTTEIRFAIPEPGEVHLTIYNALGQVVNRVVFSNLNMGVYSYIWDGKDLRGNNVASGNYFYELRAGNKFRDLKKMVLMK